MLMNSRGGPPILRGVLPLRTFSMDLAVDGFKFNSVLSKRLRGRLPLVIQTDYTLQGFTLLLFF